MNKVLVLLGMTFLLLASIGYADLIERQDTVDDFVNLRGGTDYRGQSITIPAGDNYDNIIFSLKFDDSGSPTEGTCYLEIYTTKDGSSKIADSSPINCVNLDTNNFMNFTFDSGVRLNAGEDYFIIMNSTGLDNPVRADLTSTDPYAGGSHIEMISNAVSNYSSGQYDLAFAYFGTVAISTPSDNVTFIAATPDNGTHFDSFLNLSINTSATCNLGGNATIYFDQSNPPTTSQGDNNTLYNLSSITTDGTYFYYAACSTNETATTETRMIVLDTVQPAITVSGVTDGMKKNANFSYAIYMYDLHPYLLNFTITNSTTGAIDYSEQNTTVVGTRIYLNGTVVIPDDLGDGTYDYTIWALDSHTANEIAQYQYVQSKRRIAYTTAEGNTIEIQTLADSTISTEKLKDRYTFAFNFGDKGIMNRQILVTAGRDMDYIETSEFPHWAVLNGQQGNWIDLNCTDSAGTPIYPDSVTPQGKRLYRVSYSSAPDYMVCYSVGGLNYNSVNGSFTVDTSDPIVTNQSPTYGQVWNTTTTVQFNYSVSDAVGIVQSCELLINGSSVETDSSITEGVTQTFSRILTNDQHYTWAVNCTDDYGNEGGSPASFFNVSASGFTLIINSVELLPSLPLNFTNLFGYVNGSYINSSVLLNYDYVLFKNNVIYSSEMSGAICFQEYANISTDCGGVGSGGYASSYITNPDNAWDGDYSSYVLPEQLPISQYGYNDRITLRGNVDWRGQSITMPTDETTYSDINISVRMTSRVTSASAGTCWLEIYNESTASSKYSDSIHVNCSDLNIEDYYNFTFPSNVTLLGGEDYYIIMNSSGLVGEVFSKVVYDSTDLYTDGNVFSKFENTENFSDYSPNTDLTFAVFSSSLNPYPVNGSIYFNYTISADVTAAIFQTKLYVRSESVDTVNISIPSNCLEDDTLQIMLLNYSYLNTKYEFYCLNSEGLQENIYSGDINPYYNYSFYESAIYWDFTPYSDYSNSLFNIVNISSTETQVGDNWTLSVRAYHPDTNYSAWVNSSTVTIQQYAIDNCSAYSGRALNVSFYWASNNSKALVDHEYTFNYGTTTDLIYNYSNSNIGNNFSICIFPNDTTIYSNFIIRYYNFTYNGYLYVLDNTTDQIDLYIQDNTNFVTFSVEDYSGNSVKDAYIHIMKWDIGANAYITTEIIKTNSNGEAIGNIVLFTQYYRFIVQVGGVTKLIEPESGGIRLFELTKTFRVNIEDQEWFSNQDTATGAVTSLIFNNDTNSFVYTWSDPTGQMHYGCMEVIKLSNGGVKTILNDTCTYSTSGSIIYTITPENGTTFIATGYFMFDNIFVTDILEQAYAVARALWEKGDGQEGLLFSFLLILTLSFIGIGSPVAAFALTGGGLIITAVAGLWNVTISFIVSVIIIGFIFMYKHNRR